MLQLYVLCRNEMSRLRTDVFVEVSVVQVALRGGKWAKPREHLNFAPPFRVCVCCCHFDPKNNPTGKSVKSVKKRGSGPVKKSSNRQLVGRSLGDPTTQCVAATTNHALKPPIEPSHRFVLYQLQRVVLTCESKATSLVPLRFSVGWSAQFNCGAWCR